MPAEDVKGNDYNPNDVPPPEMRLLRLSIDKDGYTQPIVGWEREEDCHIEVVDGEHRTQVGQRTQYIRERLYDHLPVTLIKKDRQDRNDRIAATIRHNRARGVHGVTSMVEVVAELIRLGWTDDEIAKELGMDADEVLRFKQNTGLPEVFSDRPYSKAWE
jgi:ParB-like chromosome segregation protein Spo0J